MLHQSDGSVGRERLWARSGAIILLLLSYCIRERGRARAGS